jgi:carbamate kinase
VLVVVGVIATPPTPDEGAGVAGERRHLRVLARSLAELAGDHQLVVVYGHTAHLALAGGIDQLDAPVDELNASAQAVTTYVLAQSLGNELAGRQAAALLTQVRVAPTDVSFGLPTEPIGPPLDEAHARMLASARGWLVRPCADGWRRLVPAPAPVELVEVDAVRALLAAGVVVTCGSGVPVIADFAGALRGVPGVTSLPAVACTVAEQLGAEHLVLLDDHHDHPLAGPSAPTRVAAGDLGPEAGPAETAAHRFASSTGGHAHLGHWQRARAVLGGDTGTVVVPADLAHPAAPPAAAG